MSGEEMAGDDVYRMGFAHGYEVMRALIDDGWVLEAAWKEASARVAAWAKPGTLARAGAEFGVETMTWQAIGYRDGIMGAAKVRPPEDVLKAYLHGYALGTARRHEAEARAARLREALEAAKDFKKTARGQGGPGVQLRLIAGGKKGAK